MDVVKGDLLQIANKGKFLAIAHGCNCFNTMGAGVAYLLATHYPEVSEVDKKTVSGDESKLGTYTFCTVYPNHTKPLYIFNLYTQYSYGTTKRHFNSNAFMRSMITLNGDTRFKFRKLLVPWIGTGLAGASREEVRELFLRVEDRTRFRITVVDYNQHI